jgi:hypothetical protein
MNAQTVRVVHNKTSNRSAEANTTRQPRRESRFDVPKSDFDIRVNVQLKYCVEPLEDSRRLSGYLDFLWRAK